jgi:hypothetical protein
MSIILTQSTITCPACGFAKNETMPSDACRIIYRCEGCGARLQPATGDCCVYCTYGSVPCPPIQVDRHRGTIPRPPVSGARTET